MSMPQNIFLSGEYTWIRPEGDYVVVGLNEYILYDHTEVCSVELPEVGEEVEAEGHFCSVDTFNGYIEVYAPISGQVVEVNDEVLDHPDLINMDPYGPGWLAIVIPDEEMELDVQSLQNQWLRNVREKKGTDELMM